MLVSELEGYGASSHALDWSLRGHICRVSDQRLRRVPAREVFAREAVARGPHLLAADKLIQHLEDAPRILRHWPFEIEPSRT